MLTFLSCPKPAFLTSLESSGVGKTIFGVVYFGDTKSANFVKMWPEKMSLLKSHILLSIVVNMNHCWQYHVHFRVVYCSNLKHWAAKWQKLRKA